MAKTDPRVDAYIAAAAPFAQPILSYLRKCMHDAHPGLAEDIKWRMPFFLLDGRPLANMAAFKAHCAFGFWKGRDVMGEADRSGEAMGQFGRITAKAELPDAKAMKALIRAAVAAAEARAAARKPKPLPTS